MDNYDGSWHGGKGSRVKKINRERYNNNFTKCFGNRLTWLEKKKLKELWLC